MTAQKITSPKGSPLRDAIVRSWRVVPIVVCQLALIAKGADAQDLAPDRVYLRPESSLTLVRPFKSTTKELGELSDAVTIEFTDKAELDKLLFLTRARNDMSQIWLGLQTFHDIYGHFPPAVVYGPDGKPWHSWRTLILPQVEEGALYRSYDFGEPWDGPKNRRLADRAPDIFRDEVYGKANPGITHYVAITGAGTAFPTEGTKLGEDRKLNLRKTPGMTCRDDLADGGATTLLVGPAPADAKIPWSKPDDLDWKRDFPPPGAKDGFGMPYKFGKQRAGAFCLATEGLGGITLTDAVSPDAFRGLLTISGGETIDVAKLPQIGPLPRWPQEKHLVIEIGIRRDGATARLFVEKVPPKY